MDAITILRRKIKKLKLELKQEREASPLLKRVRLRIKKLTIKRNNIVNNSTVNNIHKQELVLADLDSRIEELGKLLDKRGHKMKG